MSCYIIFAILCIFDILISSIDARIGLLAKNEVGDNSSSKVKIECPEEEDTERRVSAIILLILGILGCFANLLVIFLILIRSQKKKRDQCDMGLVIHQCLVDCARSAILFPLGWSLLTCHPVSPKCSLLETAFLCLATVSTIGMLTSILNSAPIFPEEDGAEDIRFLTGDNYQCVMFALFMIWFSSITVNLGPTFLSGGLAANSDDIMTTPSCPIIQGPYRHYVLNFLWIMTILFCLLLAVYHLRKLYREYSDGDSKALKYLTLYPNNEGMSPSKVSFIGKKIYKEGVHRVRMLTILTMSYFLFWCPIFLVTLLSWSWTYEKGSKSITHEVSLHICYSHAIILPLLQLWLHPTLRLSYKKWRKRKGEDEILHPPQSIARM